MSNEKQKPVDGRTQTVATSPAKSKAAPAPATSSTKAAASASAAPVPPLFRKTDWLAFAVTTLLVLIGYIWSLAPDVTLEDSGELAVASDYAGVPHPPGYPVWTIYTWLFTVLVPISNIAWRVALSSAVASALSCGLIALLVSRGSSMMLEGIKDFRGIDRKWENPICVVAGFVAGMLMGFNGFMWSQAVIVEVYTLSVLSLMGVLCFLLRWIYAPDQRRYLYWALFLFGICFTNHQTLVVAAMGIEVAVLARQPKLGRDLFAANGIVYLLGLIAMAAGLFNTPDKPMNPMILKIFHVVGLGSIITSAIMAIKTQAIGTEWKPVSIMGLLWMLGVSFYLYMPIASMTNPPLNWGYPRTKEGFIHALTRGQYESAKPTDDPFRFLGQLYEYGNGVVQEFNLVYVIIGLLPFFFYKRMQARERAWIAGLTGVYLCLAVLLLILLNPAPDKQSLQLHAVFFTSSHVIVAMAIGYGLALIGGLAVTHYDQYRRPILIGCASATAIALYGWAALESLIPLANYTAIFALLLAAAATGVFLYFRQRAPIVPMLVLFALMPVYSVMSHWWDNEQRGHLFGYWFGHDMFTPPFTGQDGKPLYPPMEPNAIVFGGTDPGRFNPTYMIFSESFLPPSKKPRDPDFDRRDCYLITQNALADGTYLNYIRAHYFRSAQHDPPFFQEFFRSRGLAPLDRFFMGLGERIEKRRRAATSYFEPEHFTNITALAARLVNPQDDLSKHLHGQLREKTKNLLGAGKESSLRSALASDFNSILEGGPLHTPDRFSHVQLSDTTKRFIAQNPDKGRLIRLNRVLLEEAYPGVIEISKGGVYPDLEIYTPSPEDSQKAFEEYVRDAQKRLQHDMANPNAPKQIRPGEDVRIHDNRIQVSGQIAVMSINALLTKVIFDKNPQHEFYVEESFPLDWMYPYLTPHGIILKINRQQQPGLSEEIVQRDREFWTQYSDRLIGNWITPDTKVKEIAEFVERVYLRGDFTGFKGDPKFIRDDNAQKAFSKLRSAIGGLYTWRINNAKSGEEQQRMVREADFAFRQSWAFCPYSPEAVFRYSNLLLSLVPHDPSRLEDAFLIAEIAQKIDPENASFQNLMEQLLRVRQSLSAAQSQLQGQPAAAPPQMLTVAELEQQHQANPLDLQVAVNLFTAYWQSQRQQEAMALLDKLADHPQADANILLNLAQIYAQVGQPAKSQAAHRKAIPLLETMVAQNPKDGNLWTQLANSYAQVGDAAKLENALSQLVTITPDSPEAWYDLAAIQATLGVSHQTAGNAAEAAQKNAQAIQSLARAIQLSDQRMAQQPGARNLRENVGVDARFNHLRQTPEFQAVAGQK